MRYLVNKVHNVYSISIIIVDSIRTAFFLFFTCSILISVLFIWIIIIIIHFRSHTYFGLKTRSPKSPVFGAMWLTQFTNKMPPPVRHWCDQGDSLLGYSWLMHDGKSFGVQELEEPAYTVKTEFVKRMGGDHGGDWTARITMTPKVRLAVF